MQYRNNTQKEFNISARDYTGRSVLFAFRIQPEQRDVIRALVMSKKLPYRSESEVYRHAVKRHLDWLKDLNDVVVALYEHQLIVDVRSVDSWSDLLQGIAEDRLFRELERGARR